MKRTLLLGTLLSVSLTPLFSATTATAQTSIVVTGYDAYGQPYTQTINTNTAAPLGQQQIIYDNLPAGAKIVDPSAWAGGSSSGSTSVSSSSSSSSTAARSSTSTPARAARPSKPSSPIWRSAAPKNTPPRPEQKPNQVARSSTPSNGSTSASGSSGSSPIPVNSGNRPPQFVLLAFDGSKSNDMWRRTREFARQEGIKFTYFISGVYFLQNKDGSKYKGPGKKRGRSDIGFGGTKAEIKERLGHVRAAAAEGHEIGSHLNGHFNGNKWTYEQWGDEMNQFRSLLRDAYTNNGLSEPSGWRNQVNSKFNKGIRAPLLGINSKFNSAARDYGYKYDTSRTNAMNYWPKKINGVWNFPLASIPMVGKGGTVLSMDYNFFAKQSGAKNTSARTQLFEDQMYESYMKYFRNNYYGTRAPVHIGHHFSLWNQGAYWRAMKRFAREVCDRREVRCVTNDELRRYMESQPSSTINAFRNGRFTKMPRG